MTFVLLLLLVLLVLEREVVISAFSMTLALSSWPEDFSFFSFSASCINSESVLEPSAALAMGMMVRVDTANTTAIKPERHLPHTVSFGSLYFLCCFICFTGLPSVPYSCCRANGIAGHAPTRTTRM